FEKKNNFLFDLAQDVLDLAQIAARARVSGVINIGGGTSRSFLHQTEVSTQIVKTPARGHKYAIQISTDAPHPGGRTSGTVIDEPRINRRPFASPELPTAYCLLLSVVCLLPFALLSSCLSCGICARRS